MPNAENLLRVAERFDAMAHAADLEDVIPAPDRWEQACWAAKPADSACGTYACIAGWAIIECRPELIEWKLDESSGSRELFAMLKGDESWTDAGAAVLGLDVELACHLFDADWRPPYGYERKGMPGDEMRAVADVLRALADGDDDEVFVFGGHDGW